MTPPASLPSPPPLPSRKWLWTVLSLLLVFALISYGVTGFFRLGREAATLRNGLLQAVAAKCDKQIELSVGSLTLHLARAGLAFVDLPAEARTALKTVRGASVGVYQLREELGATNRNAVLAAADTAMARRSWDRVVGVLQPRELVAVYSPRNQRSTRDVRFGLLVLSDRRVVVVSARGNLDPLLALVRQHCGPVGPVGTARGPRADFGGPPK